MITITSLDTTPNVMNQLINRIMKQFKNDIREIHEKMEELSDMMSDLIDRAEHAIQSSSYPDYETRLISLRNALDDNLSELTNMSTSYELMCDD